METLSPTPLGWKRSEYEQGEPYLKVRNWGSSQFCGSLGQGIKFPFASVFSYTRCTKQFNYRVLVRSDNRSGRASKGKRYTKKNRPSGLDVIISDTELRGTRRSVPELISLPVRCFALPVWIWGQSPFLCNIPNTYCPRNPLFVDKKPKGLKGQIMSLFPIFPDPTRSQETRPRMRLDSRIRVS